MVRGKPSVEKYVQKEDGPALAEDEWELFQQGRIDRLEENEKTPWFIDDFEPIIDGLDAFERIRSDEDDEVYKLVYACLQTKSGMREFFAIELLKLLIGKFRTAQYPLMLVPGGEGQEEEDEFSVDKIEQSFNNPAYNVHCCFTNERIPHTDLRKLKQRWKMCNNYALTTEHILEFRDYVFMPSQTISKHNVWHYKTHWLTEFTKGLSFDQETFCFNILAQLEAKSIFRQEQEENNYVNRSERLQIFLAECRKLPQWEIDVNKEIEARKLELNPHIAMWIWLCSQKTFIDSVPKQSVSITETEGFNTEYSITRDESMRPYSVNVYISEEFQFTIKEITSKTTFSDLWTKINREMVTVKKNLIEEKMKWALEPKIDLLKRQKRKQDLPTDDEIENWFTHKESFKKEFDEYERDEKQYIQAFKQEYSMRLDEKIAGNVDSDNRQIYVKDERTDQYFWLPETPFVPNVNNYTLYLKPKKVFTYENKVAVDAPNSGFFNENQNLFSDKRGFPQSAHPIQVQGDQWSQFFNDLTSPNKNFATYVKTKKMFPLSMIHFWEDKYVQEDDIELRIPTIKNEHDNTYSDKFNDEDSSFVCFPQVLQMQSKDDTELKQLAKSVFIHFIKVATSVLHKGPENTQKFYDTMDSLHALLEKNQDYNWKDMNDEDKADITVHVTTIHNLDKDPLEGSDQKTTFLNFETEKLLEQLPTCYPLKRMFEHPKLHKEYKHVLIKEDNSYHFCFNLGTYAQFMYTWDGTQFVYVVGGQDDDAPLYQAFTTYDKSNGNMVPPPFTGKSQLHLLHNMR